MHMLVDYFDVTHVMLFATSNRATMCDGVKNWQQMEIIGKFPTCLWCAVSTIKQRVSYP